MNPFPTLQTPFSAAGECSAVSTCSRIPHLFTPKPLAGKLALSCWLQHEAAGLRLQPSFKTGPPLTVVDFEFLVLVVSLLALICTPSPFSCSPLGPIGCVCQSLGSAHGRQQWGHERPGKGRSWRVSSLAPPWAASWAAAASLLGSSSHRDRPAVVAASWDGKRRKESQGPGQSSK